MTKTIKMSLAAVVAVAGISSSVSAKTLDEAIQGVEVSGYLDYRLEQRSNDQTGNEYDVNEYALNVTLTSKVNDMVKATVSAGFDEARLDNGNDGSSSVGATDQSAQVGVDQAYFTFDMGAATVMAGKQNIPSAFVDKKDTVKQGAGVVASTKVAGTTLAAAHFMNNNIAADVITTELVVAGKAAMVSYGLNYNMTTADAAKDTQTNTRYSVNVGAKVGPASVSLRHSAYTPDSDAKTTANDDVSVTKLDAKAKFGKVGVAAGFFMTGEDNTNPLAIDSDNDAEVHAKVWMLSTDGVADTSGMYAGVNADVMDKVNVGLTYAAADVKGAAGSADDYTATETLVMATYKMSKNFKIHARYSQLDDETTKTDLSRIQVKYTF